MKLPTKILILFWAILLIAGSYWMISYELTPGKSGSVVSNLPIHPNITRVAGQPTLLIFAHPKCPCTAATVRQLERLQANCGDAVSTTVLFLQPSNQPVEWSQTKLWAAAKRIPNVSVQADFDGQIAKQMQVYTSGTAILFDASGQSVFQGGITASRGHEGDNFGADSILSYVRTGNSLRKSTPIFGCSIFADPPTDQTTKLSVQSIQYPAGDQL